MSKNVEKTERTIGGVDVDEIVASYGTPVYAYDTAMIEEKAKAFKEAFETAGVSYQVAYASKAFSCIAMVELADQLGLSLDVVSGGELYTAQLAGFPPEKIHFHGNNKSRQEIVEALESNIGCFVVDNFHELDMLSEESKRLGCVANVLFRVTPGVEAHTHAYISTGQEDSKFGFDLTGGQALEAVKKATHDANLHVLGLHCHIGSQIFETAGFKEAVQVLYKHIESWNDEFSFVPEVMNTGGGFGIRYTNEDDPIHPQAFVHAVVNEIQSESERLQLPMPEIWIEPGRSLVGEAGTTLYTVGAEKHIKDVRHYISVDGGMSDNIRPALYDAKYEATLFHHRDTEEMRTYAIAGKACESGDMLIDRIQLKEAQPGDVLAVYSTGAYGYSMASNYNRLPKPPVVFIKDGKHQLVVRRESYKDLTQYDLHL